MILTKGEKQIDVTFRLFKEEDVKEVIACIKAEYEDTYFKSDFYKEDYLLGLHRREEVTFIIAETKDKEIAGVLALKSFYPDEEMCEIASQIFKKEYRGFGMATPIFEYGIDIIKSKDYSCMYALPVTFHKISQELLRRLGLIGTGYFLSIFLMENDNIIASFDAKNAIKHAQGIQIKPHKKNDAGIMYIPNELINYVDLIYTRLGVKYKLIQTDSLIPTQKTSSLAYKQDDKQQSCMVTIKTIGQNIATELDQIHNRYSKNAYQTFNVLIDMKDKYVTFAYRALKKTGYFFTGIKPLCSNREYMILHNPMNTHINYDSYTLSDEFKDLLDMIIEINRRNANEI